MRPPRRSMKGIIMLVTKGVSPQKWEGLFDEFKLSHFQTFFDSYYKTTKNYEKAFLLAVEDTTDKLADDQVFVVWLKKYYLPLQKQCARESILRARKKKTHGAVRAARGKYNKYKLAYRVYSEAEKLFFPLDLREGSVT